MRLKKRCTYKNLLNKKGSSEIIGFVVVVPCILAIMIFFVYMSQLFIAKQKSEYAVYTGARAIVVSDYSKLTDPVKAAKINADAIASQSLPYDFESFVTINNNDGKWVKGSLLTYTIMFKVDTIVGGEQIIRSSIVMMIENPADVV